MNISNRYQNLFWKDKNVLITGHNGFKGSWLSLWLIMLGANVYGISLAEDNNNKLYKLLQIKDKIKEDHIDIRDFEQIKSSITNTKPDVIFHLAAQPLVRESYENPSYTWGVNVMGTISILESIRFLKQKTIFIGITTDKVYKNNEWLYGYRENDPLGGKDPYSSSKAAAELAIEAWRKSYSNRETLGLDKLIIASARAGNVIGGGDWAQDRIIPDIVRAITQEEIVSLRNPLSTRPWQHVLDPLYGYIRLAEELFKKEELVSSSFNFGPTIKSNKTVLDLAEEFSLNWKVNMKKDIDIESPNEAKLLNLVSDKAHHMLNWQSLWDFKTTVALTANWYRNVQTGESSALQACILDIDKYMKEKD